MRRLAKGAARRTSASRVARSRSAEKSAWTSGMAREGVPLNLIQRQLGHVNLGITSVYLRRTRPAPVGHGLVVQAVLLGFCVMAYRLTTGEEVAHENLTVAPLASPDRGARSERSKDT